MTLKEPSLSEPRCEYSSSPGVCARGLGLLRCSGVSETARAVGGDFPALSVVHFASSSGPSLGVFHEFHVRLDPSTGELRVATPGVVTRERRRRRDEVERLMSEVRRLGFCCEAGGSIGEDVGEGI